MKDKPVGLEDWTERIMEKCSIDRDKFLPLLGELNEFRLEIEGLQEALHKHHVDDSIKLLDAEMKLIDLGYKWDGKDYVKL